MSAEGADASVARAETFYGDDMVLPFQLDRLDMRGRVARLDRTLDRILAQHAYPPSVCALIGEAALLTAMIGEAMKLRSRFSLQARGEGPVSLIATDIFAPETPGAPARMRAYAQFDPETTPETAADPFALLGQGLFAMTIDQGAHMRPYQGLTPLAGGCLSACAETYFAQSEQIAARFKTAVGHSAGAAPGWRAGGVMIQHLAEPGEGAEQQSGGSGEGGLMTAEDVADLGDRADDWRTATILLADADSLELAGPSVTPERLLIRLFHQEQPRVFPAQPIEFGCTCGPEKVKALLRRYPRDSVAEMVEDDGRISAKCQFCGATYWFGLDEVAAPADGESM